MKINLWKYVKFVWSMLMIRIRLYVINWENFELVFFEIWFFVKLLYEMGLIYLEFKMW